MLLFGPGFVAPGKNKSCSSFRLIPLLKTHGGGLDCLGGTILRRSKVCFKGNTDKDSFGIGIDCIGC